MEVKRARFGRSGTQSAGQWKLRHWHRLGVAGWAGCALLGGDQALEFLEPVLEPAVSLAAAECRTLAS